MVVFFSRCPGFKISRLNFSKLVIIIIVIQLDITGDEADIASAFYECHIQNEAQASQDFFDPSQTTGRRADPV